MNDQSKSYHVVHECNKEADIAVLKEKVEGIEEDTKAIRKALLGNGNKDGGLVTKVAVQGRSILWQTWAIRAIILAFIGTVVKVVFMV